MLIINFMAKILVTGGAGFIGSNLVDALILKGHKLVVVDDLSSGKESYLNPEAKFYKTDIREKEAIDKIFETEKPEFVYHLAAQIEVSKSMIDPWHDAEINLQGGLNILESARQNNVKKIVFSSTGGAIYGDGEKIPTSEIAATYPLSFYGIHKLAFEKYINAYHKAYGLDYGILRFSNVYGPRQFKGGEAGVIAIFTSNAVSGRSSFQYGDGLQTRDFVFVEDVVSALVLTLEKNCRQEINISFGRESSLIDVRTALSSALNYEIKIEEKESKPGEQRRSCLDNSLAKEVLGWEPKFDLSSGILKTIAWAKNNSLD